jgi:F-type H+-transporting ATPase subunit a
MGSTGVLRDVLWRIGPLEITASVVTTWLIMLLLAVSAWLWSRRIVVASTDSRQIVLEGIVAAFEDAIDEVLPAHWELVLPFVATLWIFILVANLTGLIPGLHSPTSDLSVTGSLAILVFASVHWFGIRVEGLGNYLRHYLKPNPLMLPFHLISEVSRTIALAVRLFGNMTSLELVAFLVLMVAGFLVPIPLLMLHIVEAVIQAYLFGMLALIYIAGGIESQKIRGLKKREDHSQ